MIKITNPSNCCGCSACASICIHNAIKMEPDGLGFLYPVVDTKKCVECSMCDKVCSFNDNYDTYQNLPEPIAYGARHKNIEEVMRSRSGAVFVTITDFILDNGGVVYGAGYTDHFRVVHKRATTKKERDEFRGSKYVQSDMNNVYNQIKKDLKDGLTVLFSGTPCQTSGLNSYIGKKLRANLILVDLVCHGVTGPYLWRDYIKYLEEQQDDEIIGVNFRDKSIFGWRDHHESFIFKNGGGKTMWFANVFYQDFKLRHSCSNCYFCNTRRPSDITIADFWGWDKTGSEINKDDKGVNLILINTEKGKDIFERIQSNLKIIDARPESYMQPNLLHPTYIHPQRIKFETDYINKGFKYVYNHDYNARPLIRRIIDKIKHLLQTGIVK